MLDPIGPNSNRFKTSRILPSHPDPFRAILPRHHATGEKNGPWGAVNDREDKANEGENSGAETYAIDMIV